MWILGLKGLKSLLAQGARVQASLTKSVTKTNKNCPQAGQTGIEVFSSSASFLVASEPRLN